MIYFFARIVIEWFLSFFGSCATWLKILTPSLITHEALAAESRALQPCSNSHASQEGPLPSQAVRCVDFATHFLRFPQPLLLGATSGSWPMELRHGIVLESSVYSISIHFLWFLGFGNCSSKMFKDLLSKAWTVPVRLFDDGFSYIKATFFCIHWVSEGHGKSRMQNILAQIISIVNILWFVNCWCFLGVTWLCPKSKV